jgi:Fur family peroxide stress response transcriptional regulator
MEKSFQILRQKGMRATQQRLAIFKALCASKTHLSAEEIHERIRSDNPAVSLATVYAILDLFKEKGLVNEIRIRFDKACFEAGKGPHHHFMCRRCRDIFDLNMSPCPTLIKKEVEGHSIEELQGYFYGICKNCRGRETWQEGLKLG